MAESIAPINLNQIAAPVPDVSPAEKSSGNVFDNVLGRAIDALNDVSDTEFTANKLIDEYAAGRAELSDVMIATSKMSIAVQLAVTAITSAVNTFKEITQMPI
ncbi:flagellar hook-basal body complex protein FliE [Candidatus Margulisiibacteriota bacterium]